LLAGVLLLLGRGVGPLPLIALAGGIGLGRWWLTPAG
jgi:hypothetical protein